MSTWCCPGWFFSTFPFAILRQDCQQKDLTKPRHPAQPLPRKPNLLLRHKIPLNLHILPQLPVNNPPLGLDLQLANRRLWLHQRVRTIGHVRDGERVRRFAHGCGSRDVVDARTERRWVAGDELGVCESWCEGGDHRLVVVEDVDEGFRGETGRERGGDVCGGHFEGIAFSVLEVVWALVWTCWCRLYVDGRERVGM